MIAQITGTIVSTTLGGAVVDVHGVGMHVLCAPNTLAGLRIGQSATVFTSLVVRDDSLTLYGFADVDERDMWLLVQTVSGIGPKVALAFIAVLEPDRARRALADGDLATLTTVPGIGRKGAERLVVELKDKVALTVKAESPGAVAAWQPQVREALNGLGWSTKEAEKAVDKVAIEVKDAGDHDVSSLLRLALQSMAKGR